MFCLLLVMTAHYVRASPDKAAEKRSNAFAVSTATFPDAAFNYPLPTRPMTARGSDSANPGHYENGYPIEDSATEEGMGNPLRYQGKQITSEWGNGQLLNVPTPPREPRAPPKYDPNDYFAGSETKATRDYSKPPVMRDPLPASQPKPSISSLSAKTCFELDSGSIGGNAVEEHAEQGTEASFLIDMQEHRHFLRRSQKKERIKKPSPKRWLTLKGDNLGKKDVSDVLGVDVVLVDRKGVQIFVLPCVSVKTGPPGVTEELEETSESASGPTNEDASGPNEDASGSGPDAVDDASGTEAGGSEAAAPPETAFGGEGSVLDRLGAHVGLNLLETSEEEEPGEDGSESEVVNGIDIKSGNIKQLSCVVPPFLGPDSFGYVVVHTSSMGTSQPPPMKTVIGGDAPDATNFCCPKCPPSAIELAAAVDAAVEAAKLAESEAKATEKSAIDESKQAESDREIATASAADAADEQEKIEGAKAKEIAKEIATDAKVADDPVETSGAENLETQGKEEEERKRGDVAIEDLRTAYTKAFPNL